MKLKFKQQQYQENATRAVVKCFEGQSNGIRRDIIYRKQYVADKGSMWEKEIDEDVISFGNKKIELSSDELRKNIRSVQKQNNLNYTDNEGFMNFSIEMETGTGKTYTYIKTMYELNKAYGWSKFIVMTPNIAIREGVLKSFQITQEHFQGLYGKKIRYFVYNSNNSSNLSNISNFAEDSNIQVMIINYQAFNTRSKENRKIYEKIDELQSRKPIDVIKLTNPILIVDEPQKMGKTEGLLSEFNPLFILRYSATHKKDFKYNMIYRLDAVDAYNQKLVKKIDVKGIEILHDKSESTYLYLEGVEISKSDPMARIEIEVKSTTGTKKVIKTLKKGSNLYEISDKLEQYKGYVISEIDARNQEYDKVIFTNGVEIKTGQVMGDLEEYYIARIQIRETIKSHFEKEREYYKKGIKVLSLFFIDEVAKYKVYDNNKQSRNGEYAKIFEEEYNKIYNEYYSFVDEDYKKYLDSLRDKKVHSGYFSVDKKLSKGLKDNELVYIDSKIDDKKEGTSSDEDAFDLIMRDKERLLSLDEPVRFIFSHSALREGWDNPNIFQICTLKKSNSEISKRQEIGRGLRICVNNFGERMDYGILEEDFFKINNLTVIASESYDSFSKSLQKEIAESLSRKSYNTFSSKQFEGKILNNLNGETKPLDERAINQIYRSLIKNDYIDDNDNISEKLKEDIANDNIVVPDEFTNFREEYINLIKNLYTNIEIPVDNSSKRNIRQLKPNDNFNNKEFQELWNKINTKTIYEVNFDSTQLIKRAVNTINTKLQITKMRVKITKGSQNEGMTAEQLKNAVVMKAGKTITEIYDDYIPVTTKYDLIGSIAKDTGLTRHTIVEILTKIEPRVFAMYKYNPEEFIRKASNLINEEKANTIINGIKYNKIDDKFSDEIFTINNANGRIGDNAFEVKRHIYDFIVTDSKVEAKFAQDLENGEVKVYAKLPNAYKIPTPVGNYNPDWAIVLNNKDFKYIFFIAETKGSINTTQLKGVELAKIECARKHFQAICDENVKYDVVDSYQTLVDLITKVE